MIDVPDSFLVYRRRTGNRRSLLEGAHTKGLPRWSRASCRRGRRRDLAIRQQRSPRPGELQAVLGADARDRLAQLTRWQHCYFLQSHVLNRRRKVGSRQKSVYLEFTSISRQNGQRANYIARRLQDAYAAFTDFRPKFAPSSRVFVCFYSFFVRFYRVYIKASIKVITGGLRVCKTLLNDKILC